MMDGTLKEMTPAEGAPRDLAGKFQVIKRHQGSAPVPTIAIAEDLGIKVFRAKGWRNNLSGFIRLSNDPRYLFQIYVNADHSATRRRFTIAHEIGHAVYDADRIGDGITEDALLRSGLPEPMEVRANKFAADLLMPWNLLEPATKQTTDIDELALQFEVSPQAMAIRLGVPQ